LRSFLTLGLTRSEDKFFQRNISLTLNKVDVTLLQSADEVFATSASQSSAHGATYAADFGSLKMDMTMKVMEMPTRNLAGAWERCIQGAMSAKIAVEEELARPRDAHVRSSVVV
jgi:ubiquitin carboxyl-terminal hydrolase L5